MQRNTRKTKQQTGARELKKKEDGGIWKRKKLEHMERKKEGKNQEEQEKACCNFTQHFTIERKLRMRRDK